MGHTIATPNKLLPSCHDLDYLLPFQGLRGHIHGNWAYPQLESLIKILSSHGFSSHVHGPTLLPLLHDLVGGSHPSHTLIPSPSSGLILASFTPPRSSKADMPLSLLESSYSLPLPTAHIDPRAPVARPSLLPSLDALRGPKLKFCAGFTGGRRAILVLPARASLIESPVLWAGRICGFYALLKAGLAGSSPNPLISGSSLAFFFHIYI